MLVLACRVRRDVHCRGEGGWRFTCRTARCFCVHAGAGADINRVHTVSGASPLTLAAAARLPKTVAACIDAGADCEWADDLGLDALGHAEGALAAAESDIAALLHPDPGRAPLQAVRGPIGIPRIALLILTNLHLPKVRPRVRQGSPKWSLKWFKRPPKSRFLCVF